MGSVSFNREKEILGHAKWFLQTLARRFLKESKKGFSSVQYPILKKYIICRTERELQFYRSYQERASLLVETGSKISEHDLDELMEDSFDMDRCFTRDIILLPIRIHYDYDKILPLRRERIRKQTSLFMRLLSTDGATDYNDLLKRTFKKNEYLEVHDELVELYADETFIINASLKSVIDIDSYGISWRMRSLVIETGMRMNREKAVLIFDNELDHIAPDKSNENNLHGK
jgi:hypothetical protein